MNDMKLIMESWRKYSVEDNTLTILKERADKGIITEERLAELWLKSLDDDWNQMVNEGIIDSLKTGIDAIKKGGKFVADKIMAAYEAAASKINEWITRLYIGGLDILQRSIKKVTSSGPVRKFIGGMSSLIEKVKDFKEDHPILFKVVMVAGIVAATAAVMYLMAGEANAKIQNPDNPKMVMSGAEDTWQGAKGICTTIAKNTEDREVRSMAMDCVQMINDYSPGGVYEHDVLKFSKDGVASADDLVRIAQDIFAGYEQEKDAAFEAGQLIKKQWIAAGKPGTGPVYDQAAQAVADWKQASGVTNDLIQMGKDSTYKTLELKKTATSMFQTVAGGLGDTKGAAEPDIVQGIGKAAGQSLQRILNK
tara:strand:+ start:51 stop:1145 length:1095 start_codon:yes stop_codon:yes gene_type:complete